jgi:NDP-sugar pyrophosphorylase family protein
MKAFIVAAGLGTRLRPLTNSVPKCMIDIGGHPLLWYHIMLLKHYGISEIWINTHWLADQVTGFFGDGSKFGVHLYYSHEQELLGTSGALKNPNSEISSAFSHQEFLISYGDNFTNFNYSKFLQFHSSHPNSTMSIAAFSSPEPWTQGVIEKDSTDKIIALTEKPPKDEVKSDLVNGGIYICTPKVMEIIPAGFSDFAKDIIPQLLKQQNNLYCYHLPDYLQDTGTPERYAKAQSDFATLSFPFPLTTNN